MCWIPAGDIPVPGDAALVGERADTAVVGRVVMPTKVWHLLRMAKKNSL
jgi:hypothetical protein